MIENIYTPQLLLLLNQPNILLADVREEDEFHAGHIPNAINYPLSRLRETQFPQECDIIFYCRSGYRSQIAIEYYCSHRVTTASPQKYYDYKDGYLGYLKNISAL